MNVNRADLNNAVALVWVQISGSLSAAMLLEQSTEALAEAGLENGSSPVESAATAANARLLADLLGDGTMEFTAKSNLVWLNESALLQCRPAGALLWLLPEESSCYIEHDILVRLEMMAAAQGWPLWQIVQDIDAPAALLPFDRIAISAKIDRSQGALTQSIALNKQRRSHVIAIAVFCVFASLAGLWFAKSNSWQAFLIAVIYAPLVIAAVLTVVFVWQRLKALFIARFG